MHRPADGDGTGADNARSFSAGPAGHRLPGLDGLRAASIAGVVMYHAVATAPWPVVRRAFGHGGSGVEVFFVLSGFLITWLLLREESARGRFSLGGFYARRAVRILPPVAVYLTVILALEWLRGRPIDGRGLAAAAGFCRNLTGGSVDTEHFWTLAIEEQFYLVWPLLLYACPRRARLPTVVALLALSPCWRAVNFAWIGPEWIGRRRADLSLDFLLAGALLAVAGQDRRTRDWVARPTLRSPWVVAAALVVGLGVTSLHRETGWGAARPMVNGLCIAVVVNRLVRGTVDGGTSGLDRLFNAAPVVWLGRISFSLYLWQQPLCVPEAALACRFPLNLAVALALAACSYHLIEQPALRLRRRLGSVTSGPAAPPLAPGL